MLAPSHVRDFLNKCEARNVCPPIEQAFNISVFELPPNEERKTNYVAVLTDAMHQPRPGSRFPTPVDIIARGYAEPTYRHALDSLLQATVKGMTVFWKHLLVNDFARGHWMVGRDPLL